MTTALPHAAEEYLSWLEVERGRSPRTLSSYRRDLAAYEAALGRGRTGLEAASAADVAAYLAALRRTHSAASAARALSSIRGFYRFQVEEGLRDDDPTVDLPSIPVSDLLPKALSEEETERLLGAVVGTGPAVLRDRALLEVLYGTGARVSEVVGLDLGDVAGAVEATGLPLLRVLGKGDKERVVPLGRWPAWPWPTGCRGRGAPSSSPGSGAGAATPTPSSSTPVGGACPGSGPSGWSRSTPAGWGWRRGSAPTSCAIPAPPTCWGAGPTSGSSRSCWATPPSPPRSATPRCRPNTCAGPTKEPIPVREPKGGATA